MVLMAAACFGARRPAATAGEQARQKARPDLLVYVESGNLVPFDVMQFAQQTAGRMFAGIGVRVQWATHPPARSAEPAGTGCTSVQPETIVIQMASKGPGPATGEALGSALPYARGGTRITVYYGALAEAINPTPQLARALLAHTLVHEITHVLQGVVRHSSEGVMRAHWTAEDFGDMAYKPLEFTADDVNLIRRGLETRASERCTLTPSAPSTPIFSSQPASSAPR
jgi:hypothetical protein